ncbi:Hint domain-containing protein [Aliiroseovarius sp. S253]|uniref:Hint domain-containing protein n=1 Tax=Aliiroseovarius sp. S253 TaxID=3415133 RepID=UPI003C7C1850
MANYSYIGYDPGSLVFSGGNISLSGSYDHTVDRRVFDVTDDAGGNVRGGRPDNGVIFDGDRYQDENGDDFDQTGVVTSLDGSTTYASGDIYLEENYTLSKPGGGSIEVYRVEVNGVLVGYITSEPLESGVTYTYSTSNVTPFNAPNTTDPNALTDVPCFVRGTLIDTADGQVAVENLQVGDYVKTVENGLQRINWIGTSHFSAEQIKASPKLYPIRIRQHALGQGLPTRDLLVSRQHRMMVTSKIVQRIFNTDCVLVGACKLVDIPGIDVDRTINEVEYHHILLEGHDVIFAEGAPTESFFTGKQALEAIGPDARQALAKALIKLAENGCEITPALPMPPGKLQKRLIERHAKNEQPLLQLYQAPANTTETTNPDRALA